MDLPFHFAISALLFALLYPSFGAYALLVFVGGFMVDIDHYIIYALDWKDLNPIKGYRYSKKNYFEYKGRFYLFHNLELLLLGAIGSVFNAIYIPLTLGLASHYALDILQERIINHEKIKPWSIANYILIRTGKKE